MCVRLSAFLSLPEPVAPSAAGSVEAVRSQGGLLSSASSGPAWPGGLPRLHQNPAGHTLRSGPPVKGDFSYILTIDYTRQPITAIQDQSENKMMQSGALAVGAHTSKTQDPVSGRYSKNRAPCLREAASSRPS